MEEANANAATTPPAKTLKQTTLSFARSSPVAKEESSPKQTEITPKPSKQSKTTKAASTAKKSPTPKKIYNDAVKEVTKSWNALHKKYKPNPRVWDGIVCFKLLLRCK